MRRRLALSLVAGVTATIAASALASPAAHHHKAPPHMLVIAQEWSLTLSRGSVPHGRLSVELYDRGQDAHNLNIRHLDGGHPAGGAQHVALTQSGKLTVASWRLPRGHYVLYCSLPGHEHRGMKAFLTVR